MRYEPLFFAKYVASLYTNNKVSASEAYAPRLLLGLDAGDKGGSALRRTARVAKWLLIGAALGSVAAHP
jgi:hypothetical protein